MLDLYRRHLKTCPHKSKGIKHIKCTCGSRRAHCNVQPAL
jgi:hypothetical protein